MATIRQARAAIIKGAELAGWPKLGGPGVAEMMRGLGRVLRGAQKQAAPLHAEALAAIRATAFTRRRTRGGHTETAEYARRRGLVDVALASVMRDGLLRVSEAAALRWGDVELAGDGSGRIRIPESKTDQEAEGVVLYLGTAAVLALLAVRPEEAVIDAVTPVFHLHPDTIRRRLQQAGRAAGLPGWRDITGHSGRVGMAQDLSAAGFALPELMTAGRWKSPQDAGPVHGAPEQPDGARWPGTTKAAGGRGPAPQPREAGASEGVAVSGSSTRQQYMDAQESSGTPPPGCVGTLYAALRVGVMLCVHHSFGRVGSPYNYNEDLKPMEKLALTLHKTKGTKNKVVYDTKDGEVIQSVYIDQDALGDVPPDTLQMVISPQ